jgi:hypothetical protein
MLGVACRRCERRGRLRIERLIAQLPHGALVPAELVKFCLAGKDLWQQLDQLRAGPETRSGVVPVRPELVAAVRYFGRYRSGAIRDGVLLSVC